MPKTPSYRRRVGYPQAIVTLTDSVTKQRRDFWLGIYDTAESREMYHRVIAAWEANDRRFPNMPSADSAAKNDDSTSVVVLLSGFHRWAKQYYDPGELRSCEMVIRLLRKYYGRTPAADFGPNKLRVVRDEMVRGDGSNRRPWSRKYTKQQVQRVRRMFKWGAARELVPASVYQTLATVEPLKAGRGAAAERPRVTPASTEMVDAVLPFLNRQVGALVQLQLLTGARAGELVGLRPCDVEIDDKTDVWTFRPQSHKTSHRGIERVIYLGPRAQEILKPFMADRELTVPLFSPMEAETARRKVMHQRRQTPLSCGNRPGTNRRIDVFEKNIGSQYTTDSYRKAIWYSCDKAFPPPPPLARDAGETLDGWNERLTRDGLRGELNKWRRTHRFHPHQLRHSAATSMRQQSGLEAAQLMLGHSSAAISDAVYAERDWTKIIEVVRRVGCFIHGAASGSLYAMNRFDFAFKDEVNGHKAGGKTHHCVCEMRSLVDVESLR